MFGSFSQAAVESEFSRGFSGSRVFRVRLIEQENVDMLLGFYSSAQCVPVSAKIDSLKKFMWITTCIAPEVLKVNLLASSGERFHVDTFDLYAAKARLTFIKLAAAECGYGTEQCRPPRLPLVVDEDHGVEVRGNHLERDRSGTRAAPARRRSRSPSASGSCFCSRGASAARR